jgi:hypothetical protein
MLEAEITKSEWSQWREHPVSKLFFKTISEKREEAIKVLAYGTNSGSTSKTNILVGAINAYTHILDAEFEEAKNG